MKIGIFTKNSSNFFENGCCQQSVFVYEVLSNIDGIDCYLLTQNESNILNYKTLDIDNDVNELLTFNIIINISAILVEIDVLKQLKRRNIKLIYYNCGNEYYIYQEDMLFDKHNYIKKNMEYYDYYDEMWCIPNYKKDIYFYETLFNINCKIVPYVWNDTIINNFSDYKELRYTPMIQSTRYIIIAEPNLQITKTCLTPLLICERLYNNHYKNIKIILLSQPKTDAFKHFIHKLNIYKDNKIDLYDRLLFFDIIKQLKNKKLDLYIVSHHQDNPLNFLHLETLYLQYPLIHNCEYYKQSGYYYNNIKDGAKYLLYAIKNHSNNINKYKKESRKTLFIFSPNNIDNITTYKKILNKISKYSIMNKINSIIIKPTHGFANRLKFINSVRIIAKHFKKKIYILWESIPECNIELKNIITHLPDINIFDKDISNINYVYFGNIHLGAVLQKCIKKTEYLIVSGGHEYKLPEMNVKEFIEKKSTFYKNIIWSNHINNQIEVIKKKNNLKKYITIHYRGVIDKFDGADIKQSNEMHFENTNKIDMFNTYINKINTNDYQIVLVSNKKNITFDTNNTIINIFNKTNDRSIKEDMIESILDFLIMKDSQMIIGSYGSSFSDEASFFNIIPKIMPIFKKNKVYHCNNLTYEDGIVALNYDKSKIDNVNLEL